MVLVAKWTDERGDNSLVGFVKGTTPLRILSVGGYGVVTVPDEADVYRPQRPEMVLVGKARDVRA